MLKARGAKIKSGRKRLWAVAVFGVFIAVVAGFFIAAGQPGPDSAINPEARSEVRKNLVGRIGAGFFNFEIADTFAKHRQGLSGRASLEDTQAMLFVFDEPGIHCMWMKDMEFAIDILWFDEERKLIYQSLEVPPKSYPDSYCPPESARYVVEINAGNATRNMIKLGDKLDIQL